MILYAYITAILRSVLWFRFGWDRQTVGLYTWSKVMSPCMAITAILAAV